MFMSKRFKDPLHLPPSQTIQPSKLLDGDDGVHGEPSAANLAIHGDLGHREDESLLLHLLLPLLLPHIGLLLAFPLVPRHLRGVHDRAPRAGEPRAHPLLDRIGVDFGELPLGAEGEGRRARAAAAAAAAGDAAAGERQEARGLELEHGGGGVSGLVSGAS